LAAVLEHLLQRKVNDTEQCIILVYSRVSNRNVNFAVAKVSNEAFTSGVKERLGILRLCPSLENFLVVEDNGAV
jgi:hypothetical protein